MFLYLTTDSSQEVKAMLYNSINFEIEDGVGLIRRNRPNEGNALIPEMARELLDAANRCDDDPEVRAVILAGNGKMFCAGGDHKAFAAQGDNVSSYTREITLVFHAAISRFNWVETGLKQGHCPIYTAHRPRININGLTPPDSSA